MVLIYVLRPPHHAHHVNKACWLPSMQCCFTAICVCIKLSQIRNTYGNKTACQEMRSGHRMYQFSLTMLIICWWHLTKQCPCNLGDIFAWGHDFHVSETMCHQCHPNFKHHRPVILSTISFDLCHLEKCLMVCKAHPKMQGKYTLNKKDILVLRHNGLF